MQQYTAVIYGASGAVGRSVLRELLASPKCTKVVSLGRRELPKDSFTEREKESLDAKLVQHVINPDSIEDDINTRSLVDGCDVAICTVGVGQPSAVTTEELHKVDVGYAVAFAKGCKRAGVKHYSLLSAVSADDTSSITYSRVKGLAEKGVREVGFQRTSFLRPSLIVTPEVRYGFKDAFNQAVFPKISWMFPSAYHEIKVEDLGRCFVLNTERPPPTETDPKQGGDGGVVEVLFWSDFEKLLKANNNSRS
eukprot:TRINITY_DN16530_c0_g1_i1.p1 TRINITY_DN16530_c0_g1~~TRINITY_DN16530_c0_g1_i1.p1  ORF type:complete len:251 (-),score=44.64 TRINITY_DN16530_c0_g1_i1:102-854(-)